MDFYGFEGRNSNLPGSRFGLFQTTGGTPPPPPLDTSTQMMIDTITRDQTRLADEMGKLQEQFKKDTGIDKPATADAAAYDVYHRQLDDWLRTEERKLDALKAEGHKDDDPLVKEQTARIAAVRENLEKHRGDRQQFDEISALHPGATNWDGVIETRDGKRALKSGVYKSAERIHGAINPAPEKKPVAAEAASVPPPKKDEKKGSDPTTRGDLDEAVGKAVAKAMSAGGKRPAGPFDADTDDGTVNEMNRTANEAVAYSNAASAVGLGIQSTGGAIGATGFGGSRGPFVASMSGPGGGFTYGYGGFGGGAFVSSASGGFGGFGFGGNYAYSDVFLDISSFGTSSFLSDESRISSRKLEALINFLIAQIMLGNTDAIISCMLAIGRKSQDTLRRTAVVTLKLMQQYDKYTDSLTDQYKQIDLTKDKDPSQAVHDSQLLSFKINGAAVARQMFVGQLRDVTAAMDELNSIGKSFLDISGQFKRSYSKFNV